jgi:UbiD family decarboxylase
MKKIAEGEPKMAMLTALGTELYTKQVIVVDDDVDIFDMDDVMWAVATRVRAERDVFMVPGVKSAIIDPTSDPNNFTVTKWGIDATAPLDEKFAERLTVSDEQKARARQILQNAKVI